MSDYIYENPAAPLATEAKYLACDQHNTFWFSYRPRIVAQNNPARPRWSHHDGEVNTKDYLIDGAWWETTRRIIRLSEPQYYVPENPHTDDEGFLPHDGGPMPEWCRGTMVVVKRDNGSITGPAPAEHYRGWQTGFNDHLSQITAYRIVGDGSEYSDVTVTCSDCGRVERLPYTDESRKEVSLTNCLDGWTAPPPRCPRCSEGSEDQGRQVPPHRSGGGGSLPEPDVPAFLRDWNPRWGSEGREAVRGRIVGDPPPDHLLGTTNEHDAELEVFHRNELAAAWACPCPA